MTRWLADRLRRLAERLDPPAPVAETLAATVRTTERDPNAVPPGHVLPLSRFADELELRHALKTAIRRYSPDDTGEA